MKPDETDRCIIKLLRKNARKPFTEVGRELQISDASVHVRVKRMFQEGIIKQYTILVDDEVLGKMVNGFVLLNVNPGSLEEVVEQLLGMEHVSSIYEIHRPNDLILRIWGTNLEDMRDRLMIIREIPNVTASELITVFKIWKDENS